MKTTGEAKTLPKLSKQDKNKEQQPPKIKIMLHTINSKSWTAKEERKENKLSKAALLCHNLIIIDESGSMGSIYNQALTGMNETLQTIREAERQHPEKAQKVTLVTFNTAHYNELYKETPASETKDIDRDSYNPDACTPLLDALGKALTDLKKEVKDDEMVYVTIITDRMENASNEFSGEAIRRMIDELSEKGWIFSYIGANQDAIRVAESLSIKDALNFLATPQGAQAMWAKERIARLQAYDDESFWETEPEKRNRGIKGKLFNL